MSLIVRNWPALLGSVAFVLLLAAPLGARNLVSSEQFLISEPPRADAPTPVTIKTYLHDLTRIDDVQQTYRVDMFVTVAWTDARLALPDNERQGLSRIVPMDEVWTPRMLIVNDRGLALMLPRVVSISDEGQVLYKQRIAGELSADLVFNDFPFDTQTLRIDVLSYQYTPEQVVFSPDSSLLGDAASFSAEGWDMRLLPTRIGTFRLETPDALADQNPRPHLTYLIEARRDRVYYALTLFLPMGLIVLMAWSVFWLQPDLVPSRIGISTASIFSLIAFSFSIRLNLPPVSYLTRADTYALGCTLLVFVALGVAVLCSRYANSDRMPEALRLNALARWLYLVLYALVMAAALLFG